MMNEMAIRYLIGGVIVITEGTQKESTETTQPNTQLSTQPTTEEKSKESEKEKEVPKITYVSAVPIPQIPKKAKVQTFKIIMNLSLRKQQKNERDLILGLLCKSSSKYFGNSTESIRSQHLRWIRHSTRNLHVIFMEE
jgi:hypothetical protein